MCCLKLISLWVIIIEISVMHSYQINRHINRLIGLNKISLRKQVRLFASASSSNTSPGLLSVHVHGKLTPSSQDSFYIHTLQNAMNSVKENGISRFDVLSKIDSDDEFLLIEVYNTIDGPAEHKETKHYNSWREGVADMMAVPRAASKYTTLFPKASDWKVSDASGDIDVEKFKSGNGRSFTDSLDDAYANNSGMLAVVVDVEVTKGSENLFIEATIENCENSLKESGVHRFDFMQNSENPSNFVLVEVYNSAEAPMSHKATAHYSKWAATVNDHMARPRFANKYKTLFPAPLHWHQSALHTHLGSGASKSWTSIPNFGLSGITTGSFSFLAPKISMGRGVASSAITNGMKDLNIKTPFLITGASGLTRYEKYLGEVYPILTSIGSFKIGGEPTIEDTMEAYEAAMKSNCDGIIALGGGSAIDLGKAIAALVTNIGTDVDGKTSDIYTYLESVGEGKGIKNRPLPMIAIPTTSGTGSECTKNAVIKCKRSERKASMRSDMMLPSVAVVDPLLTMSCPPSVTTCVGLDALCQVIEPFVSCMANPMTDALAREGILRASRSLRMVVANGSNVEAREDLAIASVIGGLVLANAKLGAVHGYAGVLGGMIEPSPPHGAICAILLPHVFRKNAEKLATMNDELSQNYLERFNEVARILTGNQDATAIDGALWLEALCNDLNVPKLGEFMDESVINTVAEMTTKSSSTKGNPIELSVSELEEILHLAM